MKRCFQYMLAAVAAVSAVACSQEFDEPGIVPEEEGGVLVPMTITVGSEGTTRVNVADDKKTIHWTANDILAVFEGTSSYSTAGKEKRNFAVDAESIDGGNASFTGEWTKGTEEFYAMYPFESTDSRSSGTAFNMILPNEQQLGDYNIDQKALLSIGYAERNEGEPVTAVKLQNVVGFLRVDITFDDVEEVVVSGNKIAGKVKVTGKTAVADVANMTQVSNTITLLPNGEVFEPGSYYVALMPSTTPAGEFRVTFNRTSETLTAYTSTKEVTIERNKGVFITDYKWEKGTFVIKDAADLTTFLANSSNYGEAEFANNIDLDGVTNLPTASVFEGVLDAKGYKLMNWNATAPLFDNLVGSVKNLVIDESCTLTPADAVGPFGFVAATVASGGSLENITNNSQAITLNATKYGAGASQTADAVYFGVLAGESYGTIVNCVNNADVTISTEPTSTADIRGMVYVGGLVGLIDNTDMIKADATVVGISNSENHGDIAYTVASGRGGFLFLGGVAGGTTASKIGSSTTIKAHIDGCVNTGAISNVYPDSAEAIGAKSKDNSNFTYVAGVIGYCEGSVSNSVNGELNNVAKGAITHTTPALDAGFVVANSAVAGVAGFAMTCGEQNYNYAPIVVAGSFGPGTAGSSQLGGGAQNGVSVAGVIGQTGSGTNFKTYTLSECHNYGSVDVEFNMTTNTSTTLYVGGAVGYSSTPAQKLSNNATITIVSSAQNHSVGGVMGHGYYGVSDAINDAVVDVDLVCDGGNQIDGANNCFGGVVGMIPSTSGITAERLINNKSVSVDVTGSEVVGGEIYVGGVAGKAQAKAASLINNEPTTFNAGGLTEAYIGGLCGYGSGELIDSANAKAVTATAASATAEFAVGGLLATSGATVMENSNNNGAVSAILSGSAVKAYAGGLIGYAGGKITATDCSNTANVVFSAPEAEFTELSVAGISGRSYTKSVYTRCKNSADIYVSAKSATAAHLAGIEGAPNSAAISSSNAATTDSCVNTGDLFADFPACWYVGGISSWGGTWTSTASSQMDVLNNVVECDIVIDSTTLGHYVGGVVGFSGLHTDVMGNHYEGTITVGDNTSDTIRGFVGGIVGVEAVNQTSATSAKDGSFNFSANESKAVIDCGANTYAGMLLGGVDNVSTKDGSFFTKKSNLTVNYDTVKTNKVLSGSELDGEAVTADNYLSLVMGAYNDAERFTLIENGRNSVVFE